MLQCPGDHKTLNFGNAKVSVSVVIANVVMEFCCDPSVYMKL